MLLIQFQINVKNVIQVVKHAQQQAQMLAKLVQEEYYLD